MNSIRKRFNVIDFVILIVIIGCIAGVIVRYNFVNRILAPEETQTVTVTFTAKELPVKIIDSVNKKTSFTCVSTDNSLGKLNYFRVLDSEYVYTDTNGRPRIGHSDTKKDLTGSFEVTGIKNDNGFLLNGTQFLAPGNEITIKSRDVQLSVIITEIK